MGQIRAVVLTISDSVARGERADASGPALIEALQALGATLVAHDVVPDEREVIAERLRAYADREDVNLILTTGGTGLSPRDQTPEATRDVIEREVPGLAEAMRLATFTAGTPRAILSRAIAGIRSRTLIINFPGSVRGVRETFAVIRPVLPHAIDVLSGQTSHCGDSSP
ncbi:MAG TPA: MogA/MoaB family molybdenum cofactor biosynthesis protein [Blastocatellia bacterium]|nr:MogA/MoaB family molybdenum cofactor biosynthesis protein [Blastocatellia bacterium]